MCLTLSPSTLNTKGTITHSVLNGIGQVEGILKLSWSSREYKLPKYIIHILKSWARCFQRSNTPKSKITFCNFIPYGILLLYILFGVPQVKIWVYEQVCSRGDVKVHTHTLEPVCSQPQTPILAREHSDKTYKRNILQGINFTSVILQVHLLLEMLKPQTLGT